MKLLILSATEMEVKPLLASGNTGYDLLISGVGMVATTYALTKHLRSKKYDLVLQVGVAGSYGPQIPLGDVVFITSDQFGDLGAEDHDQYLDIFEMGLLERNVMPFTHGLLETPPLPIHQKINLPQASGLTVNMVSGNEQTIKRRTQKYHCAVESMEGAAFHYVCLHENIPFAQVRAISNYVAPRDKSQWNMKDAIINLNNWLIGFIETMR